MKYLFIQFIFISLSINVLCEYAIVNDNKQSYLHHKIDNIEEDIFPRDIRINISISRLLGTLLYSIDKHMNQLIVTIHDSVPPTFLVEFNKQRHIVSMIELCNCERGRFEVLLIDIMIYDPYLYIRCNNGNELTINITKEKGLNKDYPIMFSGFKSIPESINEAHLWLVNTPDHNGVMSNSHQTYGCIFNVKYNNREIPFTDISKNVKSKCNRTCTQNVCNGGVCYETYNDRPLCNCTKTFLNGRYCNNTISSINLVTKDSLFVFDVLKLSWMNTTFDDMLRLNNKYINILFGSKNGKLFFEYSYKDAHYTTKVLLANRYLPEKENICVIYFHANFIDIKILTNGTWDNVHIPTNRDLSRELFDSLIIRSGTGVIDIYYKYTNEDKLHKMDFSTYDELPLYRTKAITNVKSHSTTSVNIIKHGNIVTLRIILILVSTVCGIQSMAIVAWLIYSKMSKVRNKDQKVHGTENAGPTVYGTKFRNKDQKVPDKVNAGPNVYVIKVPNKDQKVPDKVNADKSTTVTSPVIYDNDNQTKFSGFNSTNKAPLWPVNTPGDNGGITNSHQPYGCIFNVKYNNQEISFTDISKILKKTYNGRPLCNCTNKFLNGRYCNNTLNSINLIMKNSLFVFDILKLSWINTTIDEIIRLNNTYVNILLVSNNRELLYEYSYKNSKTKVLLSNHYLPEKENICVIYFYANFIDIKILANGTWDSVNIPTNRELSRELFNSLIIRGGTGVIDIYYKYTHEDKFHKMDFGTFDKISSNTTKAITNVKSHSITTINIIDHGSILCGIMLTIAAIVIYFNISKFKSCLLKTLSDEDDENEQWLKEYIVPFNDLLRTSANASIEKFITRRNWITFDNAYRDRETFPFKL